MGLPLKDMSDVILESIRHVTTRLGESQSESAFQASLSSVLGSCERELPVSFAPPALRRLRPPQSAIDELAERRGLRPVPPDGIDPCAKRAKLDILWHSPCGAIPIELKYCSRRKSDTYGYQFLKDLHRLERMITAGVHTTLSECRYAAFATREQVYWKGGRPEPEPFWLTHGRRVDAGYWVQYDQESTMTRWVSYPPFFLVNAYAFKWQDLQADWKCLLVEVRPQSTCD